MTLAHGDMTLIYPLLYDEVEPDGIDLTVVTTPERPGRLFQRMWKYEEVEAAEMGMGTVISLGMNDDYPFTAIPVFTDRLFRHSFMYTHADAGVADPGDLAGRRVGVQGWDGTAGVWMRGIAADHYGLDLTEVEWLVERPLKSSVTLPDRFDVEVVPGQSFERQVTMLEDGELDALLHPEHPEPLDDPDSPVVRLFEDPVAEERRYYEATGIFPIMHTVVVHDDVLAETPWAAANLYDAFCASRDEVMGRLRDPDWTPLVWSGAYAREERAVFEGSPWEFGLTEGNRRAIDAFLEYTHDQGLAARRYEPEELFVESTLDRSA